MPRRHITCQWNGQAACFIRNKCRGRAAQRPYVRLRPLAYVTGNRLTRESGLYMQGSSTSPWGSRPTVDNLEDIVFSGHVVAPEPSTWWGRSLFTARLEIAVWVSRLHIVARGTPVLGYRQWPPGPPQGRIQAYRWGQSMTGYWCVASVLLLT
jgi:hypothetical protein